MQVIVLRNALGNNSKTRVRRTAARGGSRAFRPLPSAHPTRDTAVSRRVPALFPDVGQYRQ
jgi:hypothetical protein